MLIRSFSADRCRAERNTPCTLCVAAGMMRRSRFLCSCEITGAFRSAKKKAKSGRRTRSIRQRSRRQAGEAARLFRIMPCVSYYADSYHVLRITQIPVIHHVLRSFLSCITYYADSCHVLRITQIPVMRQVKSMLSTSWSFFGSWSCPVDGCPYPTV